MSKLVIVESPTKTKSLSNYLGKEYTLKASYGHIRDLPKKELGVDVKNNFEPEYQIMPGKKKVVGELKSAAKNSEEIYLAMDPDREGEAIAFHISELISSSPGALQPSSFKRVVFHEITKDAVLDAFKHPRDLDLDLIDAWKARRILDRLVGYKLSPLLWKKVRYGLSAGRVQSVAVRLIVEREREREKFKIEPYFVIEGEFVQQAENVAAASYAAQKAAHGAAATDNGRDGIAQLQGFLATLVEIENQPVFQKHTLQLFTGSYTYQDTIFKTQDQIDEILKDLQKQVYLVEKIEKKEVKSYPTPPFTTVTLTRAAASQLGFTAKRTMRAAQILYEQGLITYHRTDSTYLAASALQKMREFIVQEFGEKFLNPQEKIFKTKSKVAQEAHEAIRPTEVGPISNFQFLISKIGEDEMKIFDLIWRRTLATQFQPAVFESSRVLIKSEDGKYLFEAKGSVLKFEGYLKIMEVRSQKSEVRNEGSVAASKNGRDRIAQLQMNDQSLPNLSGGQSLSLVEANSLEKQTTPPPRYNEGSLIRDLEKFGIGRPSTYAPIISTIQDRHYVEKLDGRAFSPTETGAIVNDLLTKHFPEIVDLKFTARMEDDLDEIANGKKDWAPVLQEFYDPFEKNLLEKEKELKRQDFNVLEKLDEKCPEDSGELVIKLGRFGKFISCANFPKCKYSKAFLETIGMKCAGCQIGDVIIKRTRRGKIFWGCSRYPECDWASWEDPRKKS